MSHDQLSTDWNRCRESSLEGVVSLGGEVAAAQPGTGRRRSVRAEARAVPERTNSTADQETIALCNRVWQCDRDEPFGGGRRASPVSRWRVSKRCIAARP